MNICNILKLSLLSSFFLFISCGQTTPVPQSNETNKVKPIVKVPDFNADSAYLYVQKQVDFGPRVPNTDAHRACASYLASELKAFGAEVIEQKAEVKAFDNTILKAVNIIGTFNAEQKNRILLLAHWDSRPFADQDANPENWQKPVLGANDGASGVGVLLEIARQMGKNLPTVGIDIIFLDAEDYGQPSFYNTIGTADSWCLGAQYWAKNPHVPNYYAQYGILLDMVGTANASFTKDVISMKYAPHVVEKVWHKAQTLGYGHLFINKQGGSITDDHVYINELAHIPCIDIIDFNNGFFEYWHTVNDNMSHIDKNTLKAVGQTVLDVIYNE